MHQFVEKNIQRNLQNSDNLVKNLYNIYLHKMFQILN